MMPVGAMTTVAYLAVKGDAARIRGLGFIGVVTLGMHHPACHPAFTLRAKTITPPCLTLVRPPGNG